MDHPLTLCITRTCKRVLYGLIDQFSIANLIRFDLSLILYGSLCHIFWEFFNVTQRCLNRLKLLVGRSITLRYLSRVHRKFDWNHSTAKSLIHKSFAEELYACKFENILALLFASSWFDTHKKFKDVPGQTKKKLERIDEKIEMCCVKMLAMTFLPFYLTFVIYSAWTHKEIDKKIICDH